VRGRLAQVTGDFIFAPRPFHQRMPDFKSNHFKFATQLVIPEAQHFDSLPGKKLISFSSRAR